MKNPSGYPQNPVKNCRISKHLKTSIYLIISGLIFEVNQLGDNVMVSKDTLYGSIIVILAILFVASLFTGGFGLVNACPVCEEVQPTQPNELTEPVQPTQPTQPEQPADEVLLQGTVELGSLPVRGDANAPVKFVEFSDYQCPYCGRHVSQTVTLIESDYVEKGKVAYYFRDFPLSFHPQALPAAIAARCADEQGMFWEMHDKLFATQESWSGQAVDDIFKGYAVELGLDNESFSSCYDAADQTAIAADFADGQNVGVQGTPTNFVLVSKSAVDEQTMKSAVEGLNDQYGDGIILFEDDTDYTVMVPGAYPFSVFETIFKTVE